MNVKKIFQVTVMPICIVFFIMSFAITASADLGPKPSIHIRFENMGDELCYGTLLSKDESTGFFNVWDGEEDHARHTGNERYSSSGECFDYETWKVFTEYEDADGYYFLQCGWNVSETKEIDWTYLPPSGFKILLYYPQTETFVASEPYEKYAFNSYYTVDMSGVTFDPENNSGGSVSQSIRAVRLHNYAWESFSLLSRIILTIVIEMAVALLFGFRRKKQFLVLAAVNVITQIVLNVLLNVLNYNTGFPTFVLLYLLFEIIVIALEAILYCTVLKKISEQPKKNGYYVRYAIVANAVSFVAGLIITLLLSIIF